MKKHPDIYVYGIIDGKILGIHLFYSDTDLCVGDTFTICYEIKQQTHEEIMGGGTPDYTPLNARPVNLKLEKMEEKMGERAIDVDCLSAASGRYAVLHLSGEGLEFVKNGCCLRVGAS
ncbi:hypothetical protein VLK31_09035 [Variovorax sp. H27-G14]|uniref:hypothetical protein n=1 Tax=Variovorax sp. H27-G14 TaxID=3111914 RepID=UPI0038FC9F87